MAKFLYVFIVLTLWGCRHNSETEKYQDARNNVVDVHDKVKEIVIDDVLISIYSDLNLVDNYLVITDWKGGDKLIHLFDKNTFYHVVSSTSMGQGPGEIANLGKLFVNEKLREFYVFDLGKLNVLSYQLDSLIADSLYQPKVELQIDKKRFPFECVYINDTLCIVRIMDILNDDEAHNELSGQWNMKTGEIKSIGYENPDVKKKRFRLAASSEYNIYVKCYSRYDLMTICSFDGKLKYNIYGPNWSDEITDLCHYNMGVIFCNDKIFALYSGNDHRTDGYYPSKIHIFNLEGEYLKTLNVGYYILGFRYDKDNNRLIMFFQDEMQFGYLDLDGLI